MFKYKIINLSLKTTINTVCYNNVLKVIKQYLFVLLIIINKICVVVSEPLNLINEK